MQTLRYKIDEEARVNAEIETYLRQHHQVSEKYPQCFALYFEKNMYKIKSWSEKKTHSIFFWDGPVCLDYLGMFLQFIQIYRLSEIGWIHVKISCYFLQILEDKVEYWMTKYDFDVDQKQHDLDVLKVCPHGWNSPYNIDVL